MASSTVKLAADISSFKSEISAGQNVLRGLKAELKATDAEFKATGNAEQKLASQTKTLNSQFEIQRGIADQARQALEKMANSGVKETDAAYQQMYATMMNATAGMNEAQAALNALNVGAEQAATGANDLTKGLNGISKKISLDQVISGIDKITDGLENAAKKAIKLGEDLWNTIMDSARRADDTATMAEMYGIDLDTFMRMQKLVAGGMDTSVDAMLSSQDRLKKGVGKGSKEVMEYLQELHVGIREGILEDWTSWKQKDPEKLFWEAGQALMNMSDAYDKEAAAQALFGKSWKELVPLFNSYKSLEEYNKALEEQTVNTEETVRDLAALNDAVGDLEGSWTTFKDELIGAIAPALTSGADAISGLLDSLTKYLQSENGQKMLEDLGTAVSGLFDDLGKIDPDKVVEGFTGVFTKVVDGVQWLSEHWGDAVTALEGIVAGWGLLKLTGGILDIVKIVSGLQGISSGSAEAAGAAAGASWGSGFAAAVLKAAPWLAALYTLLNPSDTAGDDWDSMFSNGKVTSAGWDFWNKNPEEWQKRLDVVGNRYGDLASILNNPDALNIIGNVTIDDEEMLKQLGEKLSLEPIPIEGKVEVPEGTAEDVSKQVGVLTLFANVVVQAVEGMNETPTTQHVRKRPPTLPEREHANGIWYVPYDGYLAELHRGERVMPAREVQSRSYNSNLYVESMIMNNGTDAAGLASAMAAAQQRQMSGFGS